MKRYLILLLLLIQAGALQAARRDSLIITTYQNNWGLRHKVAPGESVASVSRRYNVPESLLVKVNRLIDEYDISGIDSLMIPLGPHNMLNVQPRNIESAYPLYYRVAYGDNIYQIGVRAGVSEDVLLHWNGPMPGGPFPGRVIFVGWLKYNPGSVQVGPATIIRSTDSTESGSEAELVPLLPESAAEPVRSDAPLSLEQQWNDQTVGGQNVVTEKGTAGFFNISNGMPQAGIYAFHDAAARGTIIRVRNLNNGRAIYVKVLGPLPNAKQYAGCVLGLSNDAKAALGVRENKAFCEMSYAGY